MTEPWPPRKAAPAPVLVKCGRNDLLEHYRKTLSARWGRDVTRREAVDAALMTVRFGEIKGLVYAGQSTGDVLKRRPGPKAKQAGT